MMILTLKDMIFAAWEMTGAGVGHYLFNRDVSSNVGVVDDQGLACHT